MKLLSVGYNKSGLLCRHGRTKIPLPADMLSDIDKIKCLSLGFLKGCAVYNDGSVFGWGGKFTEKNPNQNEEPYKLDYLSNIVKAKSGYIFDIFLDKNGKVFYFAKLSDSIQQIQIDEPIIDIFGYEIAYVLGKSGNLYSIKNLTQTAEKIDFDDFIGFDRNDTIQNVITVLNSTFILTKSKKVFGRGQVVSNLEKFIEIEDLKEKNIVKIDGLYNCLLALSEEGEVYVNGHNIKGQIGLGDLKKTDLNQFVKLQFSENVRIIDCAASHSFSMFLDENGSLWSTGTSDDGCLLQGANENFTSIPKKVTVIKEKIASVFCGSCFCYIQIGGRPLSKSCIKEIGNNKKNTKSLSLKGIDSYLSFANSNEFHFLFDNYVISMNRLFADFISPKVAQLHFIDPTIDSLVISNKNDRSQIDAFEKIIKIAKGEVIKIETNELHLLAKMSRFLSNNELFEEIFKKLNNDLNMSNIFSVIEFEIKFLSDLSEKTKKFVAENFYEILKNHQKDFCDLCLDDLILFDILSDNDLVVEDEDSLYLFISGLINNDKSNIFLLECVEFSLLSDFYIKNFIFSYDTDEITCVLWRKLINLLNPVNSFNQQKIFSNRLKKNSSDIT